MHDCARHYEHHRTRGGRLKLPAGGGRTSEEIYPRRNPRLYQSTGAQMKTGTQAYTVRANRGRARIWIEGARLERAGFTSGARFTVENKGDRITLKPAADGRKVSGKAGRPIIDITGANCAPFITGDAVAITYRANAITIKGL